MQTDSGDDGDELLWARLARYVVGDCSPDEAAAIRAWASEDPARETLLGEMAQAWEQSRSRTPERWDAERAWQAVEPRVDARGVAHWRTRLAVAASLLVALGLGFAWQRGRVREYATAAGERLTVSLTDGSTVTLAPESRLRVPREYGRVSRDVVLDGEGYFSVVHDARVPFAVRVANVRTVDVGTRFDARAYPGDTLVRIVVAEGAVRTAGVMLTAADRATVDARGMATVVHRADTAALLGWTTGHLVFRDTPLRDVARELARWYGLDVRVDPTIMPRPITGAYTSGEALSEVLSLITEPAGATYRRTGRTVLILPLAGVTP